MARLLSSTHALELPEATAILNKVRKAIKLLNGNRSIAQHFQELQREQKDAQTLLQQDGEDIDPEAPEYVENPQRLFREVATRWSSTFNMLDRFVKHLCSLSTGWKAP